MSVGRWISLEARVSFKVTGGIEITVLRMAAAAALKDAALEDQGGTEPVNDFETLTTAIY